MIQWVDGTFTRWGEWMQMNRGLGSRGLSAVWGTVGGGSGARSFVPIKSIEDSRTEDWVRTLSPADQEILLEVYCTNHTSVQHARNLRMSTRTLYARLHSLQASYAQHLESRRLVRAAKRATK